GSMPHVVIASADDYRLVAALAPYARVQGVTLLMTESGRLAPAVIAELQRIGARAAGVWGHVSKRVLDDLARYVAVQRPNSSTDPTVYSMDIADRIRGRVAIAGAFGIGTSGDSEILLAVAAAAATALGWPLLVGYDAVRAFQTS